MTGMTEEQKASYLNAAKPNLCPCCGSDEIEGGTVSIQGKKAVQECSCMTCESQWEDTYSLTDVTVYE